jgi:S1-C subfamily serine protease
MMDIKDIENIKGIGKKTREALKDAGFTTINDIQNARVAELTTVPGLGEKKAWEIKEQAREIRREQILETKKDSKSAKTDKPYGGYRNIDTLGEPKRYSSKPDKPIFTKMAAVFIIVVFAMGGIIGYSVSHYIFTQETGQLQDQIDSLEEEIDSLPVNQTNQTATNQIQDIITQIQELENQLSDLIINQNTTNITDLINGIITQIQELENQLATLNTTSNTANITYQYCDATLSNLYNNVNGAIVGIRAFTIQYIWGSPLYNEVGGSGFIYNFSGQQVVITNYHVVKDTVNITITLSNGFTYPANLIGADPYADLAILSIDSPNINFETLPMVSSSTLEVGDPVIAIGNPFGFEGSMTTGIVSHLERTLRESLAGNYAIANIIQVSTPINPGNSGGPLLNYNGEVVGITTAIIEDSQGLGFAIPSNTILREIEDLVNNGSYNQHAWLGVTGIDMTYEISQVLGINVTYGWLITSVVSDGPADTAGIRGGTEQISIVGTYTIIGGDLIIALDDKKIISGDALISYLEAYTVPSQTINAKVIRDGEEIVIPIELGIRPPPG